MSSFIKDPTLASDLLAYLTEQVEKAPSRRTATLREYLTRRPAWTLATSGAVDECIKNETPASVSVRQRIIAAMASYQTGLQTLYLPVLLAWGFNQKWAVDIDTEALMSHWTSDHAQGPANTLAACYHTTAFLAQLVSVQHAFPDTWRPQVFADIAQTVLTSAQRWSPNLLPATTAGQFFVALGHTVQACPGTHRENNRPMPQRWAQFTSETVKQINFQTQMCISQDLVRSSLPGQYKLDAHAGLNTSLWAMARDTFLPLLPTNEAERFKMLPFEEPNEPVADMAEWNKEGYIDSNTNLMRRYCPQMYPVVALAASPDDWCTRASIQAWVAKFEASAPVPSIALPAGLTDQEYP